MAENISVEKSEHITEISLQTLTMKPALFYEFGSVFKEISDDPHVRAVVVYGAKKHFTYGLDLPSAFNEFGPAMQGGSAKPRTELWRTIGRLQEGFNAMAHCPVPVIAAVHGWCIGGGIDLITACDIRLCTRDAKFSVRESKVAIVADLGTLQRLPRIVGPGHARELAFTGKDIDAERARRIGLVNDVYTDRNELLAAARKLATEIAANAPLTVRGVKQVMDYGQDKSVADGLAYVAAWNAAFVASEDLGEALAAFMQKRPPEFKGQ